MTHLTDTILDKITAACLAQMVIEANSRTPGSGLTPAQILTAAAADPTGNVAVYLHNGIEAGIKWFLDFKRCPELLEVFPGGSA